MARKKRERGRRGQGSVVEVGPGRWRWYTSAMVDGRRTRGSGMAASREAAAMAMARWYADHRAGRDANRMRTITMQELFSEWLSHLDATWRAEHPRTYESYESSVRVRLVPAFGAVRLVDLRASAIERAAAQWRAAGASARTAAKHVACLRRAINWAIRQGWAERNEASLAEIHTGITSARRAVPLTVENARRIIAAPHPLRVLWLVALTTGLRVGELLGLRWEDIDLDGRVLVVARQLQRIDHELVLRERAKTPGSQARVLLPPVTVAALRRHREEQKGLPIQPRARGMVFPSVRSHDWMEPTNATRSWRLHLKALGIPYVNLHATRHTAGSLLVDMGIDLKRVQLFLRHTVFSTTADTYAHPAAERMGELADVMERIFGED